MTRSQPPSLYSIVVPVFNSRGTLLDLVVRVSKVMNDAALPFELILVDDGSKDESFQEIIRLAEAHPVVRGFRLSRNFGHQAALLIGLRAARGSHLAIIDDDLQDPPELLPIMFGRLHEGNDVAYGVRRKRKEGLI